MFGNEKMEERRETAVDTLIGRMTEVHGDIRFSGGLHLDGKVKGKIMADSDKASTLSVSESGKVEGNVRVPHVVLNGVVEGDVYASKKITLSAKAKVTGNVYYKVIEMTSGATINGQLVHQDEQEMAAQIKADKDGKQDSSVVELDGRPKSPDVTGQQPRAAKG